jgi:hypothetical protein
MSTTRRWIVVAAASAVAAVIAGQTLVGGPITAARADNQCAATCNTTHDQCMKTTNDRYTCDSQRNQCLKTCG